MRCAHVSDALRVGNGVSLGAKPARKRRCGTVSSRAATRRASGTSSLPKVRPRGQKRIDGRGTAPAATAPAASSPPARRAASCRAKKAWIEVAVGHTKRKSLPNSTSGNGSWPSCTTAICAPHAKPVPHSLSAVIERRCSSRRPKSPG